MSIFICYGEKTIIFVSIQDRLYQATEMANMTVKEQQKYDKAMFTEIDRIAQINYARKEGKAEGEAKERERIIKALKEAGVSEEVIAKAVAAEPAQ